MKIYRLQSGEQFTEELTQILEQCKNEAAKIIFSEGVYVLQKGIVLTNEHQGLSFEAEGEVHLRGAVPLTNFQKADGQIRVYDLSEEGSPGISPFVSRGFGRYMEPGHSELFVDGEPLNLSQYPKGNDFVTIAGVEHGKEIFSGKEAGPLEAGFYCTDEHLKAWQKKENIWVLGYWMWDWAPTIENIESYEAETGKLLMKEPYGVYEYCKGQRLRFYNIAEEITEPGEYCIDIENKKVYVYPPDENEIWMSVLKEPLVQIEGSREISFRGFTFEMTCGIALEANYCEGLSVKDCTLKNIGSAAINVLEGHDIHIENNTIHDCGDSGVILCGGNRCTLEPMRANVDNNHIYRIGKWTKCYQVGIHLHGVGMNARHNLIHDLPHTGIMFWGNEIHIEDNEIYRVLLESGDAGAIYTGRDYTYRGNRICHNYIHHVGNSCDITNGIYNDDCVSGTVMKDNYLEEIENGMLLGGGRDVLAENNVFVNCDTAIYFD